jgi:nickel transport system substrate-binding protein
MRKDEHSSSSFQAQKGLKDVPQYHQWIDAALSTSEDRAREKLYQDVLRALHTQAMYIPISYQVNIAVYKDDVLQSFEFPETHYEFPWYGITKR